MILVYLLGAFMDWNTLAWLVVPLPVLALMYGVFIPESPIYLSELHGYTQLDTVVTEENENTNPDKARSKWKERLMESSRTSAKMFQRR